MSPEQAEGRLNDMGPKSDVYGLGATLFFMLTGRAPVQGGNDSGDPVPSEVRRLCPRLDS